MLKITYAQLYNHASDACHCLSKAQLNTIILDMSRVLDHEINRQLHIITIHTHQSLNYHQRQTIRYYLLGYPVHLTRHLSLSPLTPSHAQLQHAYELVLHGYSKLNVLLSNIKARYQDLFIHHGETNHVAQYLQYLHRIHQSHTQLLYFNIPFNNHSLNTSSIEKCISDNYDKLSNYRICALHFTATHNTQLDFNIITQIAEFMQNFRIEHHFHTFNAYNQKYEIKLVNNYLKHNPYIHVTPQLLNQVKQFYSGVSYGFRFIDFFINKDCQQATLIMQKVQLDETPIKCPVCLQPSSKGNSYPHLLYKSFECNNPTCIARSKSGRGKRYTLLGAEKQVMVQRNNPNDRIPTQLIKQFHLDIIHAQSNSEALKDIIRFYTWSGDNVTVLSNHRIYSLSSYLGRKINYSKIKAYSYHINYHLPIVNLLKAINQNIKLFKHNSQNCSVSKINHQYIVNGNSSDISSFVHFHPLEIKSAITSPPYYNARSYSQFPNYICYLIAMLINARSVYSALQAHSVYIYNVGDIVAQDKVFVKSRMSISRLTLGFDSIMLMRIVGFHCLGDIIWFKGQVQSHRNANGNHFPMYLKPNNSYEHNLILCKGHFIGNQRALKNRVVTIPPVKKINSKGQNTLGHSAPFPIKLAELILPFSSKSGYILDPFLGSGTTCLMAEKHHLKSIGFELNSRYYQLSKKRVRKED